ncbi:MAG: hypothetical protein JNN26_14410 [Candidatus Obscuribacter sp.]|nr:hypothetical protein [Candidatus Obscuribacter sp.]
MAPALECFELVGFAAISPAFPESLTVIGLTTKGFSENGLSENGLSKNVFFRSGCNCPGSSLASPGVSSLTCASAA